MAGLEAGSLGLGIAAGLRKGAAAATLAGGALIGASTPVPLNVVYNFSGNAPGTDYPNIGNFEVSPLLQARDGLLYGVSAYGGASDLGYVFMIDPASGQLTHLHDFSFTDGAIPRGALIQGADGDLYGTTESGGANQSDYCLAVKFYNEGGCGTVFKISTAGVFTKLHDFYTAADGYQVTPSTGLVQAADGNFYGMSYRAFPSGTTSIFKMTPDGTVTVHYLFAADESQGYLAWGGLIVGKDGDLYGTTGSAGSLNGNATAGGGTVFRAGTDGSFSLLYTFKGSTTATGDGCFPSSKLLQGRDGNFYGTTSYCGNVTGHCIVGGCGTVFKLTPGGTETVLHRFGGTAKDGEYPEGDGLVQATDGSFYGTTLGNPYGEGGGFVPLCTVGGSTAFSCGTVYRIDSRGRFGTVAQFGLGDGALGQFPHASPILASDGNLYGSTFSGGGYGPGTVWRLLLNPATPILSIDSFTPAGGAPGTTVTVTGIGFTGASQVTIGNGVGPEPVPFTVLSDTQITSLIPADAQTSAIGVTAPRGTTFSNTLLYLQPVVDQIVPLSGRVGSGVTLNGAHFDGITSITFGGVPATKYSYVTSGDTSINVTVPAGAVTGPIVITNPGGSASSPVFIVKP